MSGADLASGRLRASIAATLVAWGILVGIVAGHPAIAAGGPARAAPRESHTEEERGHSSQAPSPAFPRTRPISWSKLDDLARLDPGMRSPSGRSALIDFEATLREESPTQAKVAAALDKLVAAAGLDAAWKVAVEALRSAGSDWPARYDPVTSGGHLMVKRPDADHLAPVSDFLTQGKMADLMAERVMPRDVLLMPFVYSTSGKHKLMQEVPQSRRVQGAGAERLLKGDFNAAGPGMFADMRGKTVIVMGHIVGNGLEQAFEVKGVNGVKHLRVAEITAAARANNFEWLALGCETDESAAMGTVTKINDNEAIDAFKRAMAGAGGTMGKLLTDLSGPGIEIALDLARLDETGIIPIELRDADGRVYRGSPMPGSGQPNPPALVQSGLAPDLVPVSPAILPQDACGPESSGMDRRSLVAAWLLGDGESVWMWTWTAACLAAMCLGLGEMPFLKAVPVEDRWEALFLIIPHGIGIWVAVLGCAVVAYGHDGPRAFSILGVTATIPIIDKIKRQLPDHRLLRTGAWLAAPVAWLPMLAWLGLKASAAACWIHPMPQV